MAIEAGATILGLVSAMPSGPGVIDEALIASIASGVSAQTFLLTSLSAADAIATRHQRCNTTAIQICDALPPGDLTQLRRARPGVRLVQVIHVTGDASYDEAMRAAAEADALLLDSGNPSLSIKELGGTGRTHDWRVSHRICASAGIPVFLAGGLNPDNVAEALATTGATSVTECGRAERWIERSSSGSSPPCVSASIVRVSDELPEADRLTEALREELDRRLDAYYADPASARPWREIKEELFGAK